MAGIYDMIYTLDGNLLLADVIAKEATLDITKMVVGKGYLPDGKSMGQMREVVEPVVELPIKKKVRAEDKSEILISSDFTNSDVAEEFFYRELGIFVNATYPDGTQSGDILYMYGNAGDSAERIPVHSGSTVVQKRIDVLIYVGSKTNVVIEIADGLNVTRSEFDTEIQRLEGKIDSLDLKDEKAYSYVFENVSVPVESFSEDGTYADYPYKAEIALLGINEEVIADVIFGPKEADEGRFAAVTKTEQGKVILYANAVPDEAILIPAIVCRNTSVYEGGGGNEGSITEEDVATDEEVNQVINNIFN